MSLLINRRIKESGIKQDKYLYPYDDAVEFQILTIKKFIAKHKKNRKYIIFCLADLVINKPKTMAIVPKNNIGLNQKSPNS